MSIRATCPACGDVDLAVTQIRAQLCVSDNRGSYAFDCPRCESPVSKSAEPGLVDLLVSAGVELSVWANPADADEPHDGPAFTWDDVLAFHEALEDPEWLNKLTTATQS